MGRKCPPGVQQQQQLVVTCCLLLATSCVCVAAVGSNDPVRHPGRSLLQSGAYTVPMDVPLTGQCKLEIAYYCSHVLSDDQYALLTKRGPGAVTQPVTADDVATEKAAMPSDTGEDADAQAGEQAADDVDQDTAATTDTKADTDADTKADTDADTKADSKPDSKADAGATQGASRGADKAAASGGTAGVDGTTGVQQQDTAVQSAADEDQDQDDLEAEERQGALKSARDEHVKAHLANGTAAATLQEEEQVLRQQQQQQLADDLDRLADAMAARLQDYAEGEDEDARDRQEALKRAKDAQVKSALMTGMDPGTTQASSAGTGSQSSTGSQASTGGSQAKSESKASTDSGSGQGSKQSGSKSGSKGGSGGSSSRSGSGVGGDGGKAGAGRRVLLGASVTRSNDIGSTQFHLHDSEMLGKQQAELTELLKRYSMDTNMTVSAMLLANAPVARCLRQASRQAAISITPDASGVSLTCEEDVRVFFTDRLADARLDPPLLAACAADITQLCKDVSPQGGLLLRCLKQSKPKLSRYCRQAVIARQIDAAEDVAMDAVLSAACAQDRARLCADSGWGRGAAQACLEYHLYKSTAFSGILELQEEEGTGQTPHAAKLGLSPACAVAVFNRQVEESEDIRFNYRLARACAGEKASLCPELQPGSSDILKCLEAEINTFSFSEACREALGHDMRLRAVDVRLDHRFVTRCAKDVQALCYAEESRILTSESEPPGEGARVVECLRRERDNIRSPACASHVHSLMKAAFKDTRLDSLLLTTCADDISRHCFDNSDALTCLRQALKKHESLEPECVERVQERAREAAQDIAFLPQLETACVVDISIFCSAPHMTGAQVIDCLADHRQASDMAPECREALVEHLSHAVSDVRLLHTVQDDCAADIKQLCNDTKPGEGRVLACLQQQRANISGPACKKQMLRLIGLAVEDYRLDFTVQKACKADVQQFCAGEKSDDQGAVHQCLRRSMEHLSEGCRKAQQELEQMEHEDVRLNPRIKKECPLAISSFCADVPPGNANVIMCLQQASMKPDFPDSCRSVLTSLMSRASMKYSLNVKLKAACDADVQQLCSAASDEPTSSEDLGILGCLAANSAALQPLCAAEMASLVRLHLNRYRVGMPLTKSCDEDVATSCKADQQVAPFVMGGQILSCLSKNYQSLQQKCWSLISMFDDSVKHFHTMSSKNWTEDLTKETIAEVTTKVKEMHEGLASELMNTMNVKVDAVMEEHKASIKPLMFAMVNAASLLFAVVATLALLGWYVWKKHVKGMDPRLRTVTIKDGRV